MLRLTLKFMVSLAALWLVVLSIFCVAGAYLLPVPRFSIYLYSIYLGDNEQANQTITELFMDDIRVHHPISLDLIHTYAARSLLTYSNDAQKIVYIDGINNDDQNLYLLDVRNRSKRRLTEFEDIFILSLFWSPDDQKIALTYSLPNDTLLNNRDQLEFSRLAIVDVDTGQVEAIYPSIVWVKGWSEQSLLVSDSRKVWLLDLDSRQPTPVILPDGYSRYEFALSPDGHWIVFQDSDNLGIYLKDLETGSIQKLGNNQSGFDNPIWRKDGKQITFVASNSLYAIDIPSGMIQKVMSDFGFYYAFHPGD